MVSSISSIADIQSAIPQILEQVPYLKLLVLFGSRARGDDFPSSDWDFALLFDEELRQQYEPGGGWNCYRSWVVLQRILGLGDNEIDWVDLKSASDVLTHTIASEGKVLYEKNVGEFEAFRQRSLKTTAELKQIHHEEREELELELQKWCV
jgi:predicted nucleotidyltransferase